MKRLLQLNIQLVIHSAMLDSCKHSAQYINIKNLAKTDMREGLSMVILV